MNILLIGSGGREQAIAWKLLQSPQLQQLFIAPGNAGTEQLSKLFPNKKIANIAIAECDIAGLIKFAQQQTIDLVVIGPEAPLANGLADALYTVGIAAFGPSQSAAQIEASKAFSKAFMQRHNIPTARYECFCDAEAALKYLDTIEHDIVIKASGLAAGKGVVLPTSKAEAQQVIKEFLTPGKFGISLPEIIIEEKLYGEEVSLLAFTDGKTIKAMPPARDHKRLLDHDEGPNTGGMGAYAPAAQLNAQDIQHCIDHILQPTINGLHAEGHPFVGILYAGLILTETGPQVLEFNCRFGDPETQALLLLLETDLLSIMQACINKTLHDTSIQWKTGNAACVVLATPGYPAQPVIGQTIQGINEATTQANTVVFIAGAKQEQSKVKTSGGRVLAVCSWGEDLGTALATAYNSTKHISFDGMQFRRDIGKHKSTKIDAYAAAGVDIKAGNRTVDLMKNAVRSTYGKEVLAGIGAFGGMYSAAALKDMQEPVLVASTDGVGTKVELGGQTGRYKGLGYDIVNHSINDILVQGARPLFFLDYLASSKLNPENMAEIVTGMAEACRSVGCALLGGETAEMPGVYLPNKFDIAGTIVGIVEKSSALPRANLQAGDVLIGVVSSGPHTNGYSLIRKVFSDISLETVLPELGRPLADALLEPHRNYWPVLQAILQDKNSPVKALVHLTGGGIFENIPRVLPASLGATIRLKDWPVAPLFQLIQKRGQISTDEMFRVFNMGLGMLIIASAKDAQRVQELINEPTYIVGELTASQHEIVLQQ